MMDVLEKIQMTEARIRSYICETLLERSEHLSALSGAGAYLKLENFQHTNFYARVRNDSWRIDYFCISQSLRPRLKSANILPAVMGSDHCPVSMELE